MMKVAFVCPSISRTCGGIFEIERRLAQGLSGVPETTVEVFGTWDEQTQADEPQWAPLQPRYFRYVGPSSFRYSPGLRRAVVGADVDVVHSHALWSYNSMIVQQWAHQWRRPYLITANGMLEEWAMQNSGWKKRLALVAYERACLTGAACIQVNSERECESVRRLGLQNPVCVVPNGIDVPDAVDRSPARPEAGPYGDLVPKGRRILLYLGRLHPKKGLVNLLKAWAEVNKTCKSATDWTLAIAGWDEVGHEEHLRNLVSELGLTSVVFLGPQFGRVKSDCYRLCDAFILPSFSEGMPMVVLEAWSYAKPVVMTLECNLPEGIAASAGLRIDPTAASIVGGLQQLFDMSDSDRLNMGLRGLALIRTRFAWSRSVAEMRGVYTWMLGSGPTPDCVVK